MGNDGAASPTTIAGELRTATQRLAAWRVPSARLDAEVLLRHTLGVDRTALFLRLCDALPGEERQRFEGLIQERLAGAPVAYLTGEREFMALPFAIGPGVLIPRPETETLVEWALAWLASRSGATVVDVGTGSGAIALSLAGHLGAGWWGTIIGSDVSATALAYAARNRNRLGAAVPIHLVRGSLLSWCDATIDLILANLPYLRPDQVADNPDLQAEPASGFIGGTDGLELIRRLVADAPRVLAAGGALGLEIDSAQGARVAGLARQAWPGSRVTVLPDLAGLDRVVVVETGRADRSCPAAATQLGCLMGPAFAAVPRSAPSSRSWRHS